MERRPLGTMFDSFEVSAIGLGAGPLGSEDVTDDDAVRLVHAALDRGVTLIDTAPSYGRSEVRIGTALRTARRSGVAVSTKLGYGTPGIPDWTGPCITAGVDAALARMQLEYIDIAHLHSCPVDVLARGDVLDALDAAVRAGKIRIAAYSGDNDALAWAIASGRFGTVQCSVNVADQRALDRAIPDARRLGLGVLAKRPLANAAWRERERPSAPDRGMYWDRLRAMGLPPDGVDPVEYGLRFVLSQPVSSILVGTTHVDHLFEAIAFAERGPLPADQAAHARAQFQRHDRGWDGVI
jgi:aryl-alcohol dehydrogenase-like predicted oxidoreductase